MMKILATTIVAIIIIAIGGVAIVWAATNIRAIFRADRKIARDERADADDAIFNLKRAIHRERNRK